MDIEKIIEYVMNTPENTNPAVLRGMLESLSSEGDDGGDSDFSTAEVTFVNNASGNFILDGVNIFDNKMYATLDSDDIDENPCTYLLFKGEGTIQLSKGTSNIELTGTGNVTFDHHIAIITGNCTITIANRT